MKLKLADQDMHKYLESSDVVDFHHPRIIELAQSLTGSMESEVVLAGRVYAFVRDNIAHSADIDASKVTCSASEVLLHKHGICCAKAHLLAALFRYLGIPAGFCYQWLRSDDDNTLVLHGLNAVYLETVGRWVRLDARGNEQRANARFCIDKEKLAWPVRKHLGEKDDPIVYAAPKSEVIQVLKSSKDRNDLRSKWITWRSS